MESECVCQQALNAVCDKKNSPTATGYVGRNSISVSVVQTAAPQTVAPMLTDGNYLDAEKPLGQSQRLLRDQREDQSSAPSAPSSHQVRAPGRIPVTFSTASGNFAGRAVDRHTVAPFERTPCRSRSGCGEGRSAFLNLGRPD